MHRSADRNRRSAFLQSDRSHAERTAAEGQALHLQDRETALTAVMQPIYLDYNATRPLDPSVLKPMLPYLHAQFGNPSSTHALGRRARDAVEWARSEVASLIGAFPDEIIFTSGGTEASNIAIRGGTSVNSRRPAVVTTNIEHPAT